MPVSTARRLAALPLLAVLVAAAPALAQQPQGLPATNNAAFAPLDLPAPNAYRAGNGAPGPAYWQNEAGYTIVASLDTTANRLSGTVTLHYTNNSPQALDYLWLYLEQNRFGPDSRGTALQPPDSRWRGSFSEGGFDLDRVAVTVNGQSYTPDTTITDTRMRVDLREPLAPNGGQLDLAITYSFVVPQYGADRMGLFEAAQGTVYEVAQWYPRVAVFDDVNGWNALPYLGQGEFYLDYGDYDVALTVPATMTVVATGTLQNPAEVYTAEQRQRLERAMASDETVRVIAPGEVSRAHPSRAGTATWRFRAENVRDFAWAAAPSFLLDATHVAIPQGDGSTNDVLVMAAYPKEGLGTPDDPGWEEGARYGRASILNNSRWFPYPYPAAVSVGGVVGGMEYPGIQFTEISARHMGLFGTIDHELGHNWFPMIVGSDERRYAWMDEGFNTYLNTFSGRTFYTEERRPGEPGYGLADSLRVIRLTADPATRDYFNEPYAADQTTMTYPDQLRPEALGWFAYRKPGKGLRILRDAVVGPERFDAAFEEYVRRWAYKHPQPADFFRTIEDVTGEDLDWFWNEWFYGSGTYDAAVTNVEASAEGTTITVENRDALVFPVTVEVRFADGGTERLQIPVEEFFLGDTAQAGVAGNRQVAAVTIDPDRLLPDTDRSNDTWAR